MWNPAFDVTPADLITGIITERGSVPKPASGSFDVLQFLSAPSPQLANGNGVYKEGKEEDQSTDGFVALDVDTVKDYLARVPHLAEQLGPQDSKSDWQVMLCMRPSHTT